MRQNVLKQKWKKQIQESGVVILLPLLSQDALLKVWSEYLRGLRYPQNAIDIFCRNDDPVFDSLCTKMIHALRNAVNKLMQPNF